MVKLIASDLDGTLLIGGEHVLDPEIYDLVTALQEKGITFISASGRQIASQRNLFAPIADQISYIAENGAIYLHKGETKVVTEIPRELSMRILDEVQKHPDCDIVVSGVTSCYILPQSEAFAYHIQHELNNKTTFVNSFSEISEPIVKIAAQNHNNCEGSAAYFHDLFSSEIHVITAGNDWVDFLPFDCNKGVALKQICDVLNIDVADVMAFGDQQNDLDMLRLAGISYAVATASDEVKASATHVTESVKGVLKQLLETL